LNLKPAKQAKNAVSTVYVHLDRNNCLEAMIPGGKASAVAAAPLLAHVCYILPEKFVVLPREKIEISFLNGD
jgi:hypothetical protein